MIEIHKKEDCCGCHACVQICPKQCISMHEDEEGFLYPQTDESICIDCGLCEKVCPVINQNEPHKPLEVYAAKNLDEAIRRNSSSGGVFTLFAEQTIKKGGVVFGARFNELWEVVHAYTETTEGLAAFRGSKYVQSRIGNTYKEAEVFLKAGREVLFSGTPCQIAGLRKYLRKDYPNLFLVDFICHGTPSPGVFREYLNEELQKFASKGDRKNSVLLLSNTPDSERDNFVGTVDKWKIEAISFRDKQKGWKKYSFALVLAKVSASGEKNTVRLSYTLDRHAFMRGFVRDIYLRPSCYDCSSKQLKSGSDITLGDYWGIEKTMPDYDDDRGVSSLTINTFAAQTRLAFLQSIDIRKTSFDDLVKKNPSLNLSSKAASCRALFYASPLSFHQRIEKFCYIPFSKRIMLFLRGIISLMLNPKLKLVLRKIFNKKVR